MACGSIGGETLSFGVYAMKHVILLVLLVFGSLCLTQKSGPTEIEGVKPPPGYVEAYVQDVWIEPSDGVVYLRGVGTDLSLKMHVSRRQGENIYMALYNISLTRPLTHDLFIGLIEESGMRVKYISIDRLEDGIYYATLVVAGEDRDMSVDARPSDGIVLALKADVPIYVKKELLKAEERGREEPPIIKA